METAVKLIKTMAFTMKQAVNVADRELGAIVRVLLQTEYKVLRLVDVYHQVWQPILLNQVCLANDNRQNPVGFAIFAFVSDTVLSELQENPERAIAFDEWNCGQNVWVKNFVVIPKFTFALLRNLKLRMQECSVSKVYWENRRGSAAKKFRTHTQKR
jgi:cytolysin-activating lysine-acyltransferase